MMRTTVGLLVAALVLMAMPALADFDIDVKPDLKYAKGLKWDKPTAGKAFEGGRAVSYVRISPAKGNRVSPAFITTHNYLTCPDSDKRALLNDVKEVSNSRRSGVKVLGFFFDRPACDKPTFHMEPILAD